MLLSMLSELFGIYNVDFPSIKLSIIEMANEDINVDILWLYGSQASGKAHLQSDIDLAISFKNWEDDVLER